MHIYDINDASSLLKVKKSTLYGWVHKRKIPYIKLGSKVVFLDEEIKKFVQQHSMPAIG